MPTLFNHIHKKEIDLKVSNLTVPTLLVPAYFAENLKSILPVSVNKKGKETVQLALGLKILLNKYRGLLACGELPFKGKPKLTYQEDGLDLQPQKFRPQNADWFELGIIAYGLGVSRCWLFSYLLELEFSGLGDFLALKPLQDVLATPKISRPRQILQIRGRRRFINRILHFRI